ncbi:MAG: IS1 family transposase [Taibaiella sp.]|nr:IS1 family transposase [Taibaiella sp.]
MDCIYCCKPCIKKGIKNKVQTYYCKGWFKYQRTNSVPDKIKKEQKFWIIKYNNEGMSIRSMGRILKLSPSSVVRMLRFISGTIQKPVLAEQNKEYEIDELCTYIGKNVPSNYCWITYAINRKTKQVVNWFVGKRTKENLAKVVNSVLVLHPIRIYTDGLTIYKSLIPDSLHRVQSFKINHIERLNLTLRTRIKRLSRKTICFSKSVTMLAACLQIYFWG